MNALTSQIIIAALPLITELIKYITMAEHRHDNGKDKHLEVKRKIKEKTGDLLTDSQIDDIIIKAVSEANKAHKKEVRNVP